MKGYGNGRMEEEGRSCGDVGMKEWRDVGVEGWRNVGMEEALHREDAELICISAVMGGWFRVGFSFPLKFRSCFEVTRSSLTGSPCPLLRSQPFTGDHRENPFRGSWLLLINQSINHSANPSPRLQLGQGRECAGRAE